MKTRIIHTRFYTDSYVLSLSSSEKFLFLFLLTNDRVELTGAYEMPVEYITYITKIPSKEVERILEKFRSDGKIVYNKGYIVLLNFLKYQDYSKGNENQQKAYKRECDLLPVSVREILDGDSLPTSPQLVTNQLPTSCQLDINNKEEIINKKREGIVRETKKPEFYEYLEKFNEITNSKFRMLDTKTQRQIKNLIANGYTLDDWAVSVKNASKDKFITGDNDNNKNYLTPEFISRPDKFEKYFITPVRRVDLPPIDMKQHILQQMRQRVLAEKKF